MLNGGLCLTGKLEHPAEWSLASIQLGGLSICGNMPVPRLLNLKVATDQIEARAQKRTRSSANLSPWYAFFLDQLLGKETSKASVYRGWRCGR